MQTGMQRALELIAKCKRTKATFLDLRSLNLTELPEEVKGLHWVERLYLSRNQITAISFLKDLKGLTNLNLNNNQITDISFLKDLKRLTELNLSNNQISDISFLKDLKRLTELNLSNNQITDISFLKDLMGLTNLDLRKNKITDISILKDLKGLTNLNLNNNQITDISFLKDLKSLIILNLISNQITDISFLKDLKRLTESNLSNNQITDISFSKDLKGLTNLNLNNNQITDISFLKDLKGLTTLNLSNNQITDISFLKDLKGLTTLNLSKNKVTDISYLKDLKGLINLYLSRNQITDISFSKDLKGLTTLDLSNNQITDISFSKDLEGLTTLILLGNQITDISFLKDLKSLTALNLAYNQIKDIRNLLPIIENFKEINLGVSFGDYGKIILTNNPIETPPPEIVKQGIQAIQNYFAEIDNEGVDYLYEAKMLVVGEGGAGKTSLCQKILNADYVLRAEKEDKSTEGIDIMQHRFPLAEGREFIVNLWDFGGQAVYHSTHQFFLTKRSMYILVTDSRKDDTDLQYWLHVQQLLAGDSPVWIVQNEKQHRVKDLKQNEIRGAFKNVKGFLPTNLKDNRGLSEIVKTVETQLQALSHIGDKLPKTWVAIRKALEERTENHISLQEFLGICKKQGIDDRDRAYWLSSYLHDLGVILHFQDDPVLERMVILKNEWGTDAVYRVIDNKKVIAQKGRFEMADLKEIWHEEQYQGYELELVRMMEKFKLCYPLGGKQGYIAPQLLPADKPDYEWDGTGSLQLKYQYDFMPKGILSRFIVEMHEYIKDEVVWNTGVLLKKYGAVAQVMETYAKNEIMINVKGRNPESLRAVVMHEIDEINRSFQNLEVEKLVPCICEGCVKKAVPHFFKESQLVERKSFGKNEIECGLPPYHQVDVLKMLNAIHIFDSRKEENIAQKLAGRYRASHDDLEPSKPNNLKKQQPLFICSSPKGEPLLDFSTEIKNIEKAWKGAKEKELYEEIKIKTGVEAKQFVRLLSSNKPDILHISMHASKSDTRGLYFEDKNGELDGLSEERFVEYMERYCKHNQKFKIVVLSACNSLRYANAIAHLADYVVGMKDYIPDEAAALYAEKFYEFIFDGQSVELAHEEAAENLKYEKIKIDRRLNFELHKIPFLIKNKDNISN